MGEVMIQKSCQLVIFEIDGVEHRLMYEHYENMYTAIKKYLAKNNIQAKIPNLEL